MHNEIARGLGTSRNDKHRDDPEAIKLATTASDVTEWKNFLHLDTFAAALAEAGDFANAIEWQSKAISRSVPTMINKASYQTRLKLYQKNEPY